MKSQKFLNLDSQEVHIWTAYLLENKNDVDYFYSILSRDERERASGFRFSTDQKQFIITRGILRQLLAKYLKEIPKNIEIIYGLWGKPCLPQEKILRFNVSHSGDYALYAVTRHYEVGIDLEYIDKNLVLEDIALFIFSEAELIEWKNLDQEKRITSFFTRWVSREAFLKSSGKGWIEDKSILEFDAKKKSEKSNLRNPLSSLYCFYSIPGYISALYIEGAVLKPCHYSW